MSYAASTILFDHTESECNPPQFTAHVADIREPVRVLQHSEFRIERRTVPYRLRPTLRSSLMPRSLVSGLPKYMKIGGSVQRPSDNETRKWRRRQSGRFADEIAYVAHKLAMGNLTDTRSRGPGMILSSSSYSDLVGDPHNDKISNNDYPLRAPAPESLPGSRDPGSIGASILRAGVRGCAANRAATREILMRPAQRRIGAATDPVIRKT